MISVGFGVILGARTSSRLGNMVDLKPLAMQLSTLNQPPSRVPEGLIHQPES